MRSLAKSVWCWCQPVRTCANVSNPLSQPPYRRATTRDNCSAQARLQTAPQSNSADPARTHLPKDCAQGPDQSSAWCALRRCIRRKPMHCKLRAPSQSKCPLGSRQICETASKPHSTGKKGHASQSVIAEKRNSSIAVKTMKGI
jgi:hypothetical protein